MTWQIPTWYGTILLALAAFRVWRVLAEDTILDGPRARVKNAKLTEFLLCPWCAGFWIALLWWIAWIAWAKWTLIIAVPFAISAILGLVAANIDPE